MILSFQHELLNEQTTDIPLLFFCYSLFALYLTFSFNQPVIQFNESNVKHAVVQLEALLINIIIIHTIHMHNYYSTGII